MVRNRKIKIKSEPIYDDQGNQVGVVLKYKDFKRLMEELEDLHDIYFAYKCKDRVRGEKTISFEDAKKELFG